MAVMENFSAGFIRRFQRELEELKKKTPVVVEQRSGNDVPKSRMVLAFRTPRGREWVFELSAAYPFKPPTICINGKIFQFFLERTVDDLNAYLRKYGSCGCICCKYRFHGSRWSPCITLPMIWQEIVAEEEKWHALHIRTVEEAVPRLNHDMQSLIAEYL